MLTALIREAECIGCSRCIPACPVDAIIGTNKFMHTVLLDECIGCGLCVAPCPVDCIEMLPLEQFLPVGQDINKSARADKAKQRHKARQLRLQQAAQYVIPEYTTAAQKSTTLKQEIQAAIQRAKDKNNKKNN